MNRKNIKNLILSFGVIIGIISFTPSNAVNLTFNFNRTIEVSSIDSEIRLIHFSEFKNDFGGLFYFKGLNDIFNPTQEEDEEYQYKIKDDEDYSVNCNNQLKGFYYNAERGERLWPIDEDTKNTRGFTGLNMTGGIYANCTPNLENFREELSKCSSDEEGVEEENQEKTSECIESIKEKYLDMFSFYGGVTHEYSGQNFVLAVGVKYGTGLPWIDVKPQLGKSFQWIEGEGSSLPFGLIYDNLGGVGFAGCKIKDKSALTQIVEDLIDNNTGIISLFHIQTGENDSKILVYNREIIGEDGRPTLNLVDCNSVLENANSALKILVEGLIGMGKNTIEFYKAQDDGKSSLQKTQYFASANINNATLINYAIQKAETLCRGKWKISNSYTITNGINCIIGDIALNETDINQTIIVKNGNVTIKPFSNNENKYYDIFIDSGNLIIDEGSAKKFLIKINGFVGSDQDDVINGFRDRCGAIMNDTSKIGDSYKYDELTYIGLASILKGNFIVNGSIIGTDSKNGLKNKYFIYGKLTSLDDNDKLANTFKWRCNGGLTNEESTDYCPGPRVGGNLNQYQNAPLVIIDQNYNSPMLKGL